MHTPARTTGAIPVDVTANMGVNVTVNASVDPSDYIQTETKRETKPNYASIEASSQGDFSAISKQKGKLSE